MQRRSLSRLSRVWIADPVVMAMIVLNTALLFLAGFGEVFARHGTMILLWESIFTVYFVVEIALKLYAFEPREFLRNPWNAFDVLVVGVSILSLLVELWMPEQVHVVLTFRTLRILRMGRLLHFVPESRKLAAGLKRALAASLGVVLALGLYNMVLGLVSCHLFSGLDPGRFGDPMISIWSMFKVFTIEGWFEIPDEIVRQVGPLQGMAVRAYFMFCVTTGGLLGLSLANAVFVDEMVLDNNSEVERAVAGLATQVSQLQEEIRGLRADLVEARPSSGSPGGLSGAGSEPGEGRVEGEGEAPSPK